FLYCKSSLPVALTFLHDALPISFPTAIGQASTWNRFLIQKMAGVIAAEASAVGAHNGYGPVLDLAREPRWSRTEESYGEDPYLVDRKSTRLNSSHVKISYAVFCL